MNKDLKKKIPEEVVKNNKSQKGERIIIAIDGLLHEYYHDDDLFIVERLVNKMRSELGWFEKISKHGPSVGDFYEALIKSAIHEVLPSDLKVGTGFVYDSERRDTSPQIDLIVYKDNSKPILYKRSDFVIVDSKSVVSCIEVKKTLTVSVLRKVLKTYTNANLGTSPFAPRGIQFLNIFTFYSKASIKKIIEVIKEELTEFINLTQIENRRGDKGFLFLEHLVLPNVFFLDRTGYISFSCKPMDDSRLIIKMSLNSSSLQGHSLGEFLVSTTSKNYKQKINEKNFLTYPLVMPQSSVIISEDVHIWKKFSMDELINLFPEEINNLKEISDKETMPYGAYVSSSIYNLEEYSLYELERKKGFKWLTIKTDSYK